MSGATTVGSNNYEIVEFFPVVGEDGKIILNPENAKKRCESPKERDNGETVKIPAYNGGNPEKTKQSREIEQ